MTVHLTRASEPPSAAELQQVEILRERYPHLPFPLFDSSPFRLNKTVKGGIPSDLDTDLNLVRWVRGYQGDLDKIVHNFPSYVSSRVAAGFDADDLPEKFFEMETISPFLPFIASSRLFDTQWSEEHNAFLFVERAWGQPKEFIKTFKTSDYLVHCFGYSEMLLKLILA